MRITASTSVHSSGLCCLNGLTNKSNITDMKSRVAQPREATDKDYCVTIDSRHHVITKRSKLVVSHDINVLALVKGEERYVFLYDENSRAEALRTLGRFASDPELSFSWYDAAVLGQKVRRTANEQAEYDTEPCRLDMSAIDDLWIGDEPTA